MSEETVSTPKKTITAVPLNFTKASSLGSGLGAIVLATYTALKGFDLGDEPAATLGVLLAAGLATVAAAVAAAADVLARAYVTAHTTPDPADATKMISAEESLARAIRDESKKDQIVALPGIEGAKIRETRVTPLALKLKADGATEIQIVKAGGEPEWVQAATVTFPAQ